MPCHPLVQLLHVGDGVQNASWCQEVSILVEELLPVHRGVSCGALASSPYRGACEGAYVTMRRRWFLALKCGSGKQMKIFCSWPFSK